MSQSVRPSVTQSVIRSVSRCVSQSVKQSVSESVSQSVSQLSTSAASLKPNNISPRSAICWVLRPNSIRKRMNICDELICVWYQPVPLDALRIDVMNHERIKFSTAQYYLATIGICLSQSHRILRPLLTLNIYRKIYLRIALSPYSYRKHTMIEKVLIEISRKGSRDWLR